MAFLQTTGKTPTGEQAPIPIPGLAQYTTQLLAPNQQWDSGIMPYNGNEAVHFALSSDVGGTYTIEYYLNGTQINFSGNPTTYDPDSVNAFQGALSGKGDSFKIVYKNGPAAQTRFYLEIRFGDDIQQTLRSVGVPASSTNMAGTTHAFIEGRENGAGLYKQATITPLGDKVAQDVNVVNPQAATDVSLLAKDATLTNGNQKTTIVNGNNQVLGTQANPIAVSVTNQPGTQPISGSVSVSNFPATQPVSGNVGVSGSVNIGNFPATQPISAAALPLPTGAATSAKQDVINVALGTPSDPVILDPTVSASVISLLKGLLQESVAAGTTGSFTAISLAANVQQTIAASASRKMVVISSLSGTILIGVGFTATANNWSYRIVTSGTVEIESTGAPLSISLFATSASTVNVTQIS